MSAEMMALLKASKRVRDGRWVRGAATHVLAELLTELEADGWKLYHESELTSEDWKKHLPAIAEVLNTVPDVRWDRFITYSTVLRAYGWLDRPEGRADFVLVDFYDDAGDLDYGTITSAAAFDAGSLSKGDGAEIPCQRIEDFFDGAVTNAIKLSKEKCGAQDWAYGDDDEVIVNGTCELPLGHDRRFHLEMRDGRVWAEWSGPADKRAPAAK